MYVDIQRGGRRGTQGFKRKLLHQALRQIENDWMWIHCADGPNVQWSQEPCSQTVKLTTAVTGWNATLLSRGLKTSAVTGAIP